MIIDAHAHVPVKQEEWPDFLEICQANGVSTAVVSCVNIIPELFEYPSSTQIRKCNETAFEFRDKLGKIIKVLAYLNPQNENWSEELDFCLSKGAIGIKFLVSLKDEQKSLKACFAPLKKAAEINIPVIIHTTNRTDDTYRSEATTADVAFLAEKSPSTRIVAAHAGAQWRIGLDLIKPLKNIWVDISGYLPQRTMVKELVEALGPERVLFGSDWCGFIGRDQDSQMAKVILSEIPKEHKKMILYDNAAAFFGIKSKDTFDDSILSDIIENKMPLDYKKEYFCFHGDSSFCPNNINLEILAEELKKHSITNAYVTSFESILSNDMIKANLIFAEKTKIYENIYALSVCNPILPNCPEIIEQIDRRVNAVFISPYFHNWSLENQQCKQFFVECAKRKIVVFINCCFYDYRFRPLGAQLHITTQDELLSFAKFAPKNNYIFQGLGVVGISTLLSECPFKDMLKFELSRLSDFPRCLDNILDNFGSDNIVFGSEYPLRAFASTRWVANRIFNKRQQQSDV